MQDSMWGLMHDTQRPSAHIILIPPVYQGAMLKTDCDYELFHMWFGKLQDLYKVVQAFSAHLLNMAEQFLASAAHIC